MGWIKRYARLIKGDIDEHHSSYSVHRLQFSVPSNLRIIIVMKTRMSATYSMKAFVPNVNAAAGCRQAARMELLDGDAFMRPM